MGYVESYDPDANGGAGDLVITDEEADAKRFAGVAEATECWRAQSRTLPLRPDGKPNRPMTAFTVEIRGVSAR